MSSSSNTLKDLRKKLEKRLKQWIPDNESLVNKELQIFDFMVSRRTFLKTTTLATFSMMVAQGCGGLPSDYFGGSGGAENAFPPINASDIASVTTPANIAVDADVHSSFVKYNPLPAFHSSDGGHIKDHAVMESLNTHIMTTDDTDELAKVGFTSPKRTYGIPEHVHLSKESDTSDYYLSFYEKGHSAQHGLVETNVTLNGTAYMDFNSLIATNGTFHNNVSGNNAYSQKLALLADISIAEIDYNDTSHLRLYYQAMSAPLMEPGVEPVDASGWDYIDVISEFQSAESHSFSNYQVLDANVYHDGHHNSFIYGTLSFDKYYYYGFVITFNEITDEKPSLTFFTPEFLSFKSDTIQTLKDGFDEVTNENETNYDLEDLTLFSARSFQPFVQNMQSDDTPDKLIYFSFATLNVGNNDVYLESDGGMYDLSELTDNTHLARYMLPVDTTKTVDYLLSGYRPANVKFSVDDYGFLSFVFDNSSISCLDLWADVYDKNDALAFNNFIRSIQDTGSSLEVIQASPYYDQDAAEMGLVHKSISISNSSATVETAYTLFEDGVYVDENNLSQNYKSLWHDDMKSHLGGYNSIYDTVFKNNGMQSVQFHCTHNHQGLLRCYFIIKNNSKSMLLGFNEKGEQSSTTLAYQNHDNLKDQVQNGTVNHYPPMPIAIDPQYLHKWYGVLQDGEVLFTSMRRNKIDETNQKLVENDDSSLLSYMHSSCSLTQKNWNSSEENMHVADSDVNLASTDLHQVHLHVTNIYRHPVSLHKSKNFSKEINNNIFVEVLFDKRMKITDHTDPNNPKVYHPGANSSLFLSTDKTGRISLEIDAGGKNSKYYGAQMHYRLIDKSKIKQETDTPLATVSSTTGKSTQFKKCNISFKMFQRLSANSYDQPETGVKRPGGNTVKDGLSNAIDNSGAISEVAEGYEKLSSMQDISPDNNAVLVSLTESKLWLRGSFGSSLTHFHPVSWVKHAAETAAKAAEEAIMAAKQAVDRLAQDIDDAVANIENSVTAIMDIAAAVEKLWDDAISLAEKLWDYLIALLDLDTAYDIGKELIQLRYDQLKPSGYSNNQKNIYSLFEKAENLTVHVTNAVKTKAEDLINEIFDTNVFQDSPLTEMFDSTRNSSKSDTRTSQNNSTKITHIIDQLLRLKKLLHIGNLENYTKNEAAKLEQDIDDLMTDIFGITLDDIFSGTFPEYLEESVLSFFDVKTKEELLAVVTYYPGISSGPDPAPESFIRKMQNNATEVKDHIQTFVSGSTDTLDVIAQLEKTFKNTSLTAVDSIDDILDVAIKMPTEFLKDDNILEFMTSSGPVLDKLLKPLGTVLFLDSEKFKNIEDVAAFSAGFAINIAPVMAESAYNKVSDFYSEHSNGNLDLSSFITDGTLRTNLNQFIDISHNILDAFTSNVINEKNIKAVAKSIAAEVAVLADKVIFKMTNLVIDLVGLIVQGLEKITSLINKIPPIKDPIFDAIAAVLHVTISLVQMTKIQPAIIEFGLAIAEYVALGKRSISEIVLMAIQAVCDTICYILDFIVKINEAGKAMGKGQPGEVVLYDPLRVALISVAGFFVAGVGAFVMDIVSVGFRFASIGYGLYSNGISDLIKDAAYGATVVLELIRLFFSFNHLMSFLYTEILGYVVKSIDIELIIAGVETIALPVLYVVVWGLYLTSLTVETILSGITSLTGVTADISAFIASEV